MDGGAWWAAVHGVATERLHFDFSLSCIGEGNGNPLQYSCLENPRDGGAWWAAIHRVTKSQTQLKRLSSQELVMDREPGVLPSMESQRAGHDSASKQQREQPTYLLTFILSPTPCSSTFLGKPSIEKGKGKTAI